MPILYIPWASAGETLTRHNVYCYPAKVKFKHVKGFFFQEQELETEKQPEVEEQPDGPPAAMQIPPPPERQAAEMDHEADEESDFEDEGFDDVFPEEEEDEVFKTMFNFL